VTSAANLHYQKHFDRLFALARAGDWDAVRDYKVTGSNSYSKMVVRYPGFAGRARRFGGPPMSNHEARADAGSILRHRPLTYRIIKEI
jgi:hypothetical protein